MLIIIIISEITYDIKIMLSHCFISQNITIVIINIFIASNHDIYIEQDISKKVIKAN